MTNAASSGQAILLIAEAKTPSRVLDQAAAAVLALTDGDMALAVSGAGDASEPLLACAGRADWDAGRWLFRGTCTAGCRTT